MAENCKCECNCACCKQKNRNSKNRAKNKRAYKLADLERIIGYVLRDNADVHALDIVEVTAKKLELNELKLLSLTANLSDKHETTGETFNPTVVARIARHSEARGFHRCKIVASVLFALDFDDLACRAAKYINAIDMIMPVVDIAKQAAKDVVLAISSIEFIAAHIVDGALTAIFEWILSLMDMAIATLPNLPTIFLPSSVGGATGVMVVVEQIKELVEAAYKPLKVITELLDYEEAFKQWKEALESLEEVIKTKLELECICHAYKELTSDELSESRLKL